MFDKNFELHLTFSSRWYNDQIALLLTCGKLVCVCVRESERKNVCLCKREREKEREREREITARDHRVIFIAWLHIFRRLRLDCLFSYRKRGVNILARKNASTSCVAISDL